MDPRAIIKNWSDFDRLVQHDPFVGGRPSDEEYIRALRATGKLPSEDAPQQEAELPPPPSAYAAEDLAGQVSEDPTDADFDREDFLLPLHGSEQPRLLNKWEEGLGATPERSPKKPELPEVLPTEFRAYEQAKQALGPRPVREVPRSGSRGGRIASAVFGGLSEALGGTNWHKNRIAREEAYGQRDMGDQLAGREQDAKLLPLIAKDTDNALRLDIENRRAAIKAAEAAAQSVLMSQPIDPALLQELGLPQQIKNWGEAKRFVDMGGDEALKFAFDAKLENLKHEHAVDLKRTAPGKAAGGGSIIMGGDTRSPGTGGSEGGAPGPTPVRANVDPVAKGREDIRHGRMDTPEATRILASQNPADKAIVSQEIAEGKEYRSQVRRDKEEIAKHRTKVAPVRAGLQEWKRYTDSLDPAQLQAALDDATSMFDLLRGEAGREFVDKLFQGVLSPATRADAGASMTPQEKEAYQGLVGAITANTSNPVTGILNYLKNNNLTMADVNRVVSAVERVMNEKDKVQYDSRNWEALPEDVQQQRVRQAAKTVKPDNAKNFKVVSNAGYYFVGQWVDASGNPVGPVVRLP